MVADGRLKPPPMQKARCSYVILEHHNKTYLESLVREKLARGYELAGGVSVRCNWFVSDVYVQALFKLF